MGKVKNPHPGINRLYLFCVKLLAYAVCAGTYIWIMGRKFFFLLNFSRTLAIVFSAFTAAYLLMCRIYGGVAVGEKKSRPILFSMGLVLFFTDLIAQFFLSVMNITVVHSGRFVFETPLRLFIIYIIQLVLVACLTYAGNDLFFRFNPPAECLIVTKSGAGHRKIVRELKQYKKQYHLIGAVSYDNPEILTRIDQADLVFFYGLTPEERSSLVEHCYQRRISINYSLDIADIVALRGKYTSYHDQSFLASPEKQMTLEQRFLKRSLDLVVSGLGLLITSPLFLIVSLAIKLEDRGPVFYKQKRATDAGRSFYVIKFRSMRSEVGGIHKSVQKDDDRITRIGRFIRKFRIDELPQLINVIRGDMSLVGPRPEMLENVEKYTAELPEFAYRQKMKAGLTGLAQIYGRYNTSPKDKLLMDLTYIEQYSFGLDLVLLFRTVLVLLTPEESTEAFESADPEEDIVE